MCGFSPGICLGFVWVGQTQLRDWLFHLGMQELYGAFLQQGFDDLEFIVQAGLSDSDLDAVGVTLNGHRCCEAVFPLSPPPSHDPSITLPSPSHHHPITLSLHAATPRYVELSSVSYCLCPTACVLLPAAGRSCRRCTRRKSFWVIRARRLTIATRAVAAAAAAMMMAAAAAAVVEVPVEVPVGVGVGATATAVVVTAMAERWVGTMCGCNQMFSTSPFSVFAGAK